MKINNYIRGDDRVVNIQVYESDGVTPFNLTGCEAFFTLNSNSNPTDDTTAAISLSSSFFQEPATGVVTFLLTNALTSTLNPGTYYYDVQIKDTTGKIVSLKQDTFTVIADITRRTT